MIHTHNEFNARPPQPTLGAEMFTAQDFTAVLPEIERTFAEHDARIRELQHAVAELANAPETGLDATSTDSGCDQAAALAGRVAQLEGRLVEQDRMIRHTLTMLIEWIETQGSHARVD